MIVFRRFRTLSVLLASYLPSLNAFQVVLPSNQQLNPRISVSSRQTATWSTARRADGLDRGPSDPPLPDVLIVETSRALQRTSWFSWWSQVILTTISSVILIFARNVVGGGRSNRAMMGPVPSFILSGAGVIVSAASIIWTWGNGSRLSRRMIRKPTTYIQAATLLRRAIRIGVTLNCFGLLLNLIAAEEIVGALAIKVLTRPNFATQAALMGTVEGLQPLDILIVQANTNSLLSHFCSLVSLLYLTDRVHKLDPPSTEGDMRRA